jgi:hypothetical protein
MNGGVGTVVSNGGGSPFMWHSTPDFELQVAIHEFLPRSRTRIVAHHFLIVEC